MKKYKLNENYNIWIIKRGEYYIDTLIDLLNEENNIMPGWSFVYGIQNDLIKYRIVKKK